MRRLLSLSDDEELPSYTPAFNALMKKKGVNMVRTCTPQAHMRRKAEVTQKAATAVLAMQAEGVDLQVPPRIQSRFLREFRREAPGTSPGIAPTAVPGATPGAGSSNDPPVTAGATPRTGAAASGGRDPSQTETDQLLGRAPTGLPPSTRALPEDLRLTPTKLRLDHKDSVRDIRVAVSTGTLGPDDDQFGLMDYFEFQANNLWESLPVEFRCQVTADCTRFSWLQDWSSGGSIETLFDDLKMKLWRP